jgi:Holliday junction resolvase
MGSFERDVVHCLNNFFSVRSLRGFAYRLKQSKFNTQYVDVLVDSLDPRYYLAIECKSIRGKKLYFSQHFHLDRKDVHQVESISEFLERTGRRGFIAVEFRSGPGRAKEAYLLPWDAVRHAYGESAGLSVEEFRSGIALLRECDSYVLPALYPKEL